MSFKIVDQRINSELERIINFLEDKTKRKFDYFKNEEIYLYNQNTMEDDIKGSSFWTFIKSNYQIFNREYYKETGYELFDNDNLKLNKKTFNSFLLKTNRKNKLENESWPNEPENGWVLPNNWYSKIDDIVRSSIIVNYLDGVIFVKNQLEEFCKKENLKCKTKYKAETEGYYAIHLYIVNKFELKDIDNKFIKSDYFFEIQITTKPQELIKRLLHQSYELRRDKERNDELIWQWNYRELRFKENYLGHLLHYLEGMIIEMIETQRSEGK